MVRRQQQADDIGSLMRAPTRVEVSGRRAGGCSPGRSCASRRGRPQVPHRAARPGQVPAELPDELPAELSAGCLTEATHAGWQAGVPANLASSSTRPRDCARCAGASPPARPHD